MVSVRSKSEATRASAIQDSLVPTVRQVIIQKFNVITLFRTSTLHYTTLKIFCIYTVILYMFFIAALQCPQIATVPYGSMNCSHPVHTNGYNSTCVFSCEEGFELTGSHTTVCDHTGRWTHNPPTCTGSFTRTTLIKMAC